MKQLQDDLWQTEVYSMGVLNTHAYLLTRDDGNILFYNPGHPEDIDCIAELGGITHQLLTHRDETGPMLNDIRSMFGSKLCCSVTEKPFVEEQGIVDLAFSPQDTNLGDIQIFHTPGHTDGSICFFYKSPSGKSYLFTGDSIFQSNGKWSTFVLPNGGATKDQMADSLRQLRSLDPDIVMSSGFLGDVSEVYLESGEWAGIIDIEVNKLTAAK